MRPRFGNPRAARLAPAFALAALMSLALARGARAQSPADDRPSLARYVPKDELVILVEFDGLDAHAEAWRKTAAYKILNDTPAGAMIEDLLGQLATKLPQTAGKVSAAEAVAVVKHLARSGFVFAAGGERNKDKPRYEVLVLRDAFKNKDVRPAFARALQGLNAPNSKPQPATRAGHKVVAGKMADGDSFSWWVEESKKEDLIVARPSPDSPDYILEAIDGKRPAATELPSWAEASKPDGGFTPALRAFINPSVFRDAPGLRDVGLDQLTRFEVRGGFQDVALAAVFRVSSPRPHAGLLGLFDGPNFDRSTMTPMPAGQTSYAVASLNVLQTFDGLIRQTKVGNPAIEDQVNRAADAFKAKTKLRLREDLLAHLGPKVAWYIVPTKPALQPAPAATSPISLRLAMLGIDQIPKAALVIDIDNPATFGKSLDELMSTLNREIKARASQAAGMPGGVEGGNPRGGRNRGPGMPGVEFRLMPGENKSYVLSVPSELSAIIPAGVRPTIRVVGKQLIIAMSPEVARMAQEAKGPYAPPQELASAFESLSPGLKYLAMADPRDTLPAVMAALPGKLQASINRELIKRNVQAIAPAGGATPAPAAPAPNPGGGMREGRGRSGEPGRPGGPVAPAAPPAATEPAKTPAGIATITLQIDPARLPSADSIRSLLFPSLVTVDQDGEGFKMTYRFAFPNFGDPSKVGLLDRFRVQGGQMPSGAVPRSPTDGFFDIPPENSATPPQPPAGQPPARPGRPGMGGRGAGRGGPD